MAATELREFATRYTAAWCSQNAGSVAVFFAENGSLKINDTAPSVGRAAITAAAQGFMSTFPDMVVSMDDLSVQGAHAVYRWTLTGPMCNRRWVDARPWKPPTTPPASRPTTFSRSILCAAPRRCPRFPKNSGVRQIGSRVPRRG